MIRGHPPHPRLVLRRGPQPYPHRARSREHDPLRRFAIGLIKARGLAVAETMRRLARNPRRVLDFLKMTPTPASRSTRPECPLRVASPSLATRPRHTRTTAHARRPRQWTVMPKGSAIRPPKHGDIRHRAPERAAMKATRRVLDARDSTPTIRTNLP